MIRELMRLLGPEHRRAFRVYLGWLVVYGVLQGLAMALLVPTLRGLLTGDHAGGLAWLGAMALVTVLAGVTYFGQSMRGFDLALISMETLHRRLGDHVATLPLGWFTGDRMGRLSRTASSGTMFVGGLPAHLLAPAVTGVVTPATVGLALLVFDWRLGLTALASAPLIYLAVRVAARMVGAGDELYDAAAVAASSRVVEFARAQPTLRAFGRGVEGYAQLDDALAVQHATGGRALRMSAPGLLFGTLSVQVAFAALIVVAVLLALGGTLDPVGLVAALALAARFTGPLSEVAVLSGAMRMARNELRRLTAILDTPALPEPDTSVPVARAGEIELCGVTFGYTPGEPVLRDVSLRMPPRTMTALVGASGSGKTTLTRLIARFFDVDAGTVSVGGVDVRAQSTEDLMAQLSLVFQDVYLFDDTLEANIRIGRASATEDEVREAARLAGVTEIADRLPHGWTTRVGEGGAMLSGGERQRVSIARAVLKDAPIVLLDEATAALDPQNERYVQAAMRSLMHRSTLVVIAHKLSTVVAADRIVVLDDGRIAETGTHDELLAAGGRYAAFWDERRRARGWRLTTTREAVS